MIAAVVGIPPDNAIIEQAERLFSGRRPLRTVEFQGAPCRLICRTERINSRVCPRPPPRTIGGQTHTAPVSCLLPTGLREAVTFSDGCVTASHCRLA